MAPAIEHGCGAEVIRAHGQSPDLLHVRNGCGEGVNGATSLEVWASTPEPNRCVCRVEPHAQLKRLLTKASFATLRVQRAQALAPERLLRGKDVQCRCGCSATLRGSARGQKNLRGLKVLDATEAANGHVVASFVTPPTSNTTLVEHAQRTRGALHARPVRCGVADEHRERMQITC